MPQLAWDFKKPKYKGIDLTKPDPRLKPRSIEIEDDRPETSLAFVDVNIIDSTGKPAYRGDVLVKGKRIVSVGSTLSDEQLKGVRVVQGHGRTLMSGLADGHTHFTWTNAGSLDGLATMGVEGRFVLHQVLPLWNESSLTFSMTEHTLFSMRSARTFLDCGYTMCLGAASAKARLDAVMRNSIRAGDIPGPRFLANGQEVSHSGDTNTS